MESYELVLEDGTEINKLSPDLRHELISSWRKTTNEKDPMVFDISIETHERYTREMAKAKKSSIIKITNLGKFRTFKRKYIFIYERPVWDIFGTNYDLCENLGYKVQDYYIVKDIYDRNILLKLIKRRNKVKFVKSLFSMAKELNGVRYLFAVSEGIITGSVNRKMRTVIEHYGICIINTSNNTMYTPNIESNEAEYIWDKLTEKEIKSFGI